MALSSKESAWLGSAHPLPASSLGPLLRFDRCRVQLAGLVAFRDQVAARQRSQRVTTYIGVSDARDTPCPRARGTPSRSPRAPLAPPLALPSRPASRSRPPRTRGTPRPRGSGIVSPPPLPLWLREMARSPSQRPLPSWHPGAPRWCLQRSLCRCPSPLTPALAVGVTATAPPDAASLPLASSPVPLWHRRCTAPARAVTPCP